jgi:hypothetical protein
VDEGIAMRKTAAEYLNILENNGILRKQESGKRDALPQCEAL